jgi:RNA polymerase sigma factor (sigma-70 family)
VEPFGANEPLAGVESLVRRSQGGDPLAVEQLVRERSPYVGRICGSIALDQGEDAAQETMTLVVRKICDLREPAALHGWVRRIAVRESIRVARRSRDAPVDPVELSTIRVGDSTEAATIRDVLRRLPPEQRAVLVLRHLYELPEEEVATVLGVPLGTLEESVPRFEANVRDLRVLRRSGNRLEVSVTMSRRLPQIRMDVVLEEGWCWMASRPRLHVVGMAASPEGDRTRFALLEGTTLPLPGPVRWIVAPLLWSVRRRHLAHVGRDLAGIADLVEGGPPGPDRTRRSAPPW